MTAMLSAVGSALLITCLFYVPGLAWAWLFPGRGGALRIHALAAGFALAIGVPIVLVPTIVLAECGRFSTGALLAPAVVAAGTGCWFGRRFLGATLCAGWPGFVAIAALSAALLAWPHRGEWIVGGWDPGVNVNQGLLLAHEGTLRPPVDPVFARMVRDAPGIFTRSTFNLTEAYPGAPIDASTGAWRLYFYRGTPTLVAIFDRLGGLGAALRVNYLLGLYAVVTLGAVLLQCCGIPAAVAGVAVFVLQPIFLNHLHTPASEMAELFFLCGIGLLLTTGRTRTAAPFLALLLLSALLNRVSFLLFGALGLGLLACVDFFRPRPREAKRGHLAWMAALVLGLAWYARVAPESTAKIGHILPDLQAAVAGSVILALAIDLARCRWTPRRFPASWVATGLLAALLATLAYWEAHRYVPWREAIGNVRAWSSYAGRPQVLLAAAGLALILSARATRRGLAVWIALLALGLAMTLLHKSVADLYPWATKRWLPLAPPLLAAGTAAIVDALGRWRGRPAAIVGLVVVACAIAPGLRKARDAWRNTEYDGAAAALQDVARAIGTNDVVLADHFLWAMPLTMAMDRTVLNGERVWAARDPAKTQQAVALLESFRREGRRVLLLTSTGRGAGLFPEPLSRGRLIAEWPPLALHEIIHHRAARAYALRDRTPIFRLYEWEGAAP